MAENFPNLKETHYQDTGIGVPVVAQWLTNPTRNHEVAGSYPALLWLWRRPVATVPIQPLAWEPPYAAGAAQEIATTTKRQKKKKSFY